MAWMRRLLPLAIALGAGLAALLWGLATLESIVIDERHQARDGIASQEAALAEYARRTLELRLQAQLHDRTEALEQSLADPLAPSEGLLLVEGDQQRLPPYPVPLPGDQTPARALYDEVRAHRIPPGLEEGAPARRRVELVLELRDALERDVRAEIEEATWALLRHRTMFVIDSTLDVPMMVAMLDDFSEHSRPTPELMAMLLRDGYGRKPNVQLDALQRLLLRRRERFSAADFEFLAERVTALSKASGVEVDDFVAAAHPAAAEAIPRPRRVLEPMLLDGGRWFVAPHSPTQLRGVEVDAAGHVDALQDEMLRRGLLQPEDRIALPPLPAASDLDSLPFEVHAPRFQAAKAEAEARFWLKSGFVGGCTLLALGIVVLALSLQRRRNRFVELKSDFVATVSHELRTPLASIRLMAETLERRTRDVPAARDYPQRIVRDIDELAFLVENILSFNRLDKGRWRPRSSDVELEPLVDELLEDLPQYGFDAVQAECSGLDVIVHGDRELLKLLLRNLMKNACTYNERRPVQLELRGHTERSRFVLEVADNGVGIPAGEQGRIFEDFRRVAGTRARGSGLGLSICRKTMEAHGGRIRIGSSGPEGTRFVLEFPGAMVRPR